VIRFALSCTDGHDFEGWFASSAGFDTQRANGEITCPICGAAEVDKALMAPAVATSRRRDSVRVAAHGPQLPDEPEIVAKLRQIRKHLTEGADYVGDRFAEEARRIHYDEVEKRGIYGEATSDEVRALSDEGIEFHPLPVLPEDHN
jgi:hypothetical protein